MKNKKKIIIYIIVVLGIVGLITAVSYGYLTSEISGNETGKKYLSKARELKIEYSDGSESIVGNNQEFVPGSSIVKKFSVKDIGDVGLYYNVIFDDIVNDFNRKDDITYELYKDDNFLIKEVFPSSSGVVLSSIKIDKDETQNYTLKIYYANSSENQIEDSGKKISGKITFEENKTPITKYNIYGNTLTTYTEGTTEQDPEHPATLSSLGTLVTDVNDVNYGKYKIDLTVWGKNLWDRANFIEGNSTIRSAREDFLASKYPWIKANTTYSLGADITFYADDTRASSRLSFQVNYDDGTLSGLNPNWKITKDGVKRRLTTKATTSDKKINRLVARLMDYGTNSGGVWHATSENIQLEVGSVSTEYEPYRKDVYSLYLKEPLRCVGDYCDYIDLVNKKVVRQIYEKTFTGSERWQIVTNALVYNLGENFEEKTQEVVVNSNNYKPDTWGHVYSGSIGISRALNRISIRPADPLPTVDEFKATLKEMYDAGNPLKVYYLGNVDDSEKINLPDISKMVNIYLTDGNLEASKVEKE